MYIQWFEFALWVGLGISIAFLLGFIFGNLYHASKGKSLRMRVRTLENFKGTAEALCPKLTSGVKNSTDDSSSKQTPWYESERIAKGNPRDF